MTTCNRCQAPIPEGRQTYYLKLGPWCQDCLGNAFRKAESYRDLDQMRFRGRILMALGKES